VYLDARSAVRRQWRPAAGVLLLLARLRDAIGSRERGTLFWDFSVAEAAACIARYALWAAVMGVWLLVAERAPAPALQPA
jgi:hypothetical protein